MAYLKRKENNLRIFELKQNLLEPQWNLYGTSMEPQWNLNGTSMDPQWNQNGTSMEPQTQLSIEGRTSLEFFCT